MTPPPQDPRTTEPRPASSWRTLVRAMAPRATRAQVIVGLLCAVLGFALVVQVRSNRDDALTSLRQDELVRILDDVTRRSEELEEQIRITILHETAHFFGLDDDDLDAIGLG